MSLNSPETTNHVLGCPVLQTTAFVCCIECLYIGREPLGSAALRFNTIVDDVRSLF